MKLYVPEIGDHIKLTAPWKFNLHSERRNTVLGAFFGYYMHRWSDKWVKTEDLAPIREMPNVPYPDREDFYTTPLFGGRKHDYGAYQEACNKAQRDCVELQEWQKENEAYRKDYERLGKKIITVELPIGTVLAIDRLYIRKGSSDYSSITFYAKELGEITTKSRWSYGKQKPKKNKALRFWAKLEDCNRIEFESVEK